MGYVMLSARKLLLQSQINNYEHQLMQLSQEKLDLHKYSSAVYDGYIDFNEMAGMPISMLGLAFNYATNPMAGHGAAYTSAREFAETMLFPGIEAQRGQALDPRTRAALFNQVLRSRLAEMRKVEEQRIKQIEDELDHKMKMIETRRDAVKSEYESVTKAEEAAIQRSTPKYA